MSNTVSPPIRSTNAPIGTHNPAPSSPRDLTIFAIAALLGLALYVATCMPGVGWQDCAMFQYRVWRTDITGELGLALAHPLYVALAKLFSLLPIGELAYRVNLFSAFCGALTLGFTAVLLRRLTSSHLAAAVGTIVLAVSHTFWIHAVLAELYDLYALFLILELLFVERFVTRRQPVYLILALLTNGLNVSVHDLALLHDPAYLGLIFWAWRQRIITAKHILLAAIAFLIGSSLFTAIILSAILKGQPLFDALREALTGRYYSDAVLATHFSVPEQLKKSALYFALNFPTPLILCAPLGVYFGWKNPRLRWFCLFAGAIFLINFAFAFRYLVADAYKFFTPGYVIFALFIGLAVPHLGKPSTAKACIFLALAMLPTGVYELAPSMLQHAGISLGVGRELPTRDNYAYFIRPRKNGDDGADRFARVALNQAGPDGVLIATGDSTLKNVLNFVRDVEGVQPGVSLTLGPDYNGLTPQLEATPNAIAPFVSRGQAYVCSDNPGYLLNWIVEGYNRQPVADPPGIVFRLTPK